MKTNPILVVLLLVLTNMHAQYFQKMYNINATSNDLAGKGVNDVLTGGNNLYVQTGTSIFTTGGATVTTTAPMVASTDNTGAQIFCAAYPFPLLNGNTVIARGRAIARDPNNGNLIVLGDFTSTPVNTTGIFFFQVTAVGAVVPGSLNYFFHPTNRVIEAAAIKVVPGATTQIIACGRSESTVTAGSFNPWAAKFNVAFTAGWFKIYDEVVGNVTWNARANDLVEAAFTATSTEIGVVGEQINANNYRGFLMRLNPANGNLLNYTTYDLSATSDDRLTSITKCNNTVPAVGYIMAGYTNINGTTTATPKVWAIRTNNIGTTVNWSNRYTYPNNAASCFANGIVERNNVGLGVFEYYISGTTSSGVIGAADAILYKVAPNGNLSGNNVVTIGVPGATNEYGINIDKSDVGTTVPGLTIYGQRERSAGNNDFYKIKCYFNGKITVAPGCKDSVRVADRISQATSTVAFVAPTQSLTPKVQPNPSIIDGNQTIICNTVSIVGGSNARMIATASNFESAIASGELAVNAYPNPLRNNQELQLAINSPQDQLTTLTVINMLGQVIYSVSKDMKTGLNTLQLTLPELKEGIYTVNVTSGKSTKNVLISITN